MKRIEKVLILIIILIAFISCVANIYYIKELTNGNNYINMLERNIYARDKQDL